jgi:anti-sigma regulatory factor (Ser/Thr protein kinase)
VRSVGTQTLCYPSPSPSVRTSSPNQVVRRFAGRQLSFSVVALVMVRNASRSGRAFVRAAHYWTETHPEIAFRPVQQCLTNIHRHSGSKTALIRLEREGDRVHVKVEDQGNGMSPERLAEVQSHGTGVGITGMRERIRHFCGDLVVESNGSGTSVCATFPLKPRPSRDPSKTQQDVA